MDPLDSEQSTTGFLGLPVSLKESSRLLKIAVCWVKPTFIFSWCCLPSYYLKQLKAGVSDLFLVDH